MSGLVPLGDPDAVVCDGDACIIPSPPDAEASATSRRD